MALFFSKSVNKIDGKGRVSLPANFRAALGTEISDGVAIMPALRDDGCLEGFGMSRVAQYAEALEHLNPQSEERAALEMMVLSEIRILQVDNEGRIVLPEDLRAHAGMTDQAVFAGLGKTFQIWSPAAYAARLGDARQLARKSIHLIDWNGAKPAPPQGS